MARNSLAPGFLRIFYIGPQNIQHVQTIGVKPSSVTPGSATIQSRDNTSYNLAAAWAIMKVPWKGLMAATVTWQQMDLWSQPTPSDDPIFVETLALNEVGTNGTASIANSQILFSWRALGGGRGKTVFLEASATVNQVLKPPAYGNAQQLAVVTYLTGPSCIVYARDNSYPGVVPKAFTKTNDAMRKKTVLGAP